MNVDEVRLSPIFTGDATWATAVFELVTMTDAPFDGAGPASVIVAVDEAPPTTAEGLTVNDTRGGDTMITAVTVAVPYAAVMVTLVLRVTLLVETVNVP